jgi:hypothetical protein
MRRELGLAGTREDPLAVAHDARHALCRHKVRKVPHVLADEDARLRAVASEEERRLDRERCEALRRARRIDVIADSST